MYHVLHLSSRDFLGGKAQNAGGVPEILKTGLDLSQSYCGAKGPSCACLFWQWFCLTVSTYKINIVVVEARIQKWQVLLFYQLLY